jgi:alpha-1,2-mannosyltransferase
VQRIFEVVRDGSWLTRERLAAYSTLLLAGYLAMLGWIVLSGGGVLDAMGRPIGTDFANIWSSGRLVLEGRAAVAFDPDLQRPYQQLLLGTPPELFYGWHYPPMFLAVAALLASLPYLPALAVWLVATGAFYVHALRRIVPVDGQDVRLVVLAALSYPAVLACVTHGHNGFLTAALFGFGLWLLPAKPTHAGVLLGLLAYKPQYGLLLPLALLATAQWRAMASAAATVAATAAMSAALFGVASWQAFFAHAGFTKETILENGAAGWFKLQGLFPAVRMYGGSVSAAYALQIALIGALGIAIIWLWRSRASYALKSAGLILATMLATPYSFNYDSVLLGAAIAFIVADGLKRGFAPFEISALALLWITPLFSRELTAALYLPIALLVQSLLLAMLFDKVWRAQSSRLAHV